MLQQWSAAREIYELGMSDIEVIARCLGKNVKTVHEKAKHEKWEVSASAHPRLTNSILELSHVLSNKITDLSVELDHKGFNETLTKQLTSLTRILENIRKLIKENNNNSQKNTASLQKDESIMEFRKRLEKQIEILTNTKPADKLSKNTNL